MKPQQNQNNQKYIEKEKQSRFQTVPQSCSN